MVDSGVHRALRDENSQVSIDDQLKDAAEPVLIVAGGHDSVVPPERQVGMARKLQRCKEVVFPGQGHMFAIESAVVAAREILALLETCR